MRIRDELLEDLEEPHGTRPPGAQPGLQEAVEKAYEAAKKEAERRFDEARRAAIDRLMEDRELAMGRIELAARRGDALEAQSLRYQLDELERFYDRAKKALEAAQLELDQAAGFLPRG